LARKKRGKAKRRSTPRRASRNSGSGWAMFGVGIIVLLLKVIGIAFLVQGFLMQIVDGRIWIGTLHYGIGILAVWGAHRLKSSCCK
jgi:hypothetical protein